MDFKELKEELLKRAKNSDACRSGYAMGVNAQNKQDLLKAITANWHWVLSTSKMIDAAFLEANFTEEELKKACIYTKGIHKTSTVAFACGSSTVEACGSSTVEACGSSTVKAYDNSYVEDCTKRLTNPSGYAIIKDYWTHKIYIKKGKFQIIEVE